MKIVVLTLFKEMYDSFLGCSIIKRAIGKGLVDVKLVDIRDYTTDKYGRCDTPPIGGGAGLILKAQPIIDALRANSNVNSRKIILSPRGKTFNQQMAKELSKEEEIVLLCGHYEGIDERVYDYFDESISIGDFILTGGETASFCIIDAISRLIPGVITSESLDEESFNNYLLEQPQYTEPFDFEGKKVPLILYSGNHTEIEKFNQYHRLMLTKKYREDLFNKYTLTKQDKKILASRENGQTPDSEIDAIEKSKKFIKNL